MSEPWQSGQDPAILRAILTTAVDAIIMIDDQGIIRHANPAATRMFGYSFDELVGHNVKLLMPAPYHEEHDSYIRNYLRTRNPRIIGIGREVMARKKDGTLFPIDLAVSEVPLEGTTLFTGIVRDMTDRCRIEDELRRERTFAEDLIETANAIVLILDEQGRISRFNHYMEQLCGYSLDEVRGRDWFEQFIKESDRAWLREVFEKVVVGELIEGTVNAIVTRSGEERIITWSARHLVDCDSIVNGVLAIGNDITDLMATERLLIQNERLAAIGQMVTGLAHESRNALQRSRACLDLLELDVHDHADQLAMVQRAQHALDELQRLYEEVRNYASPLKLELSSWNLVELLHETWDQLTDERNNHVVEFRVHSAPNAVCKCDRNRIIQVFRNILENSLCVSPSGGVITATCHHGDSRGTRSIQVAICDQGPGLTSEQSANIFEPFYTTKTKGTGLGMAIARRIVEAHSGEISVGTHSPGTQIIVTLPLGADDATE